MVCTKVLIGFQINWRMLSEHKKWQENIYLYIEIRSFFFFRFLWFVFCKYIPNRLLTHAPLFSDIYVQTKCIHAHTHTHTHVDDFVLVHFNGQVFENIHLKSPSSVPLFVSFLFLCCGIILHHFLFHCCSSTPVYLIVFSRTRERTSSSSSRSSFQTHMKIFRSINIFQNFSSVSFHFYRRNRFLVRRSDLMTFSREISDIR